MICRSSRRFRVPLRAAARALGAFLLLAPGQVLAATPASNILVADADAGLVSPTSGGAVLNVGINQARTSLPATEASARSGAPFEYPWGIDISPVDGRAYIIDQGYSLTSPVPKLFAVDGVTGDIETIAQGGPLVKPYDVAVLPDGRIVIADPAANPLGPPDDCLGTVGTGGLYVVNPITCTPPCAISLLSSGNLHFLPATTRTVFCEPSAVAWDDVTDRLYVVESAFELNGATGGTGAIYAVDVASGAVTLISADDEFRLPVAVDVLPDGDLVVVDWGAPVAGAFPLVFKVDVDNADRRNNATLISTGDQYGLLESVTIDATGRIFVVDSGIYDDVTGLPLDGYAPKVFRIDEALPADSNGIIINESSAFVTPLGSAAVPLPVAVSVSPTTIDGPTAITITGEGLFPGLTVDLGPGIVITGVDYAPTGALGTALQATATPTPALLVPQGCTGSLDLTLTHPFGGSTVLEDAILVNGGTGGIVPRPPASREGDANVDGIVDGLDLAILGRYYATEYCDGLAFFDDADFNDDDIIDGRDLAILAAFFGTRP